MPHSNDPAPTTPPAPATDVRQSHPGEGPDPRSIADAREVVLDFSRLAFVQGRYREAFERYVADGYVQHNAEVADGREAAIGFFAGLWAQFPSFRYEIRHILTEPGSEGTLVCLHAFASSSTPGDRGAAIFDLFMVRDGWIVEHWDAVQMIPADAANDHPMF